MPGASPPPLSPPAAGPSLTAPLGPLLQCRNSIFAAPTALPSPSFTNTSVATWQKCATNCAMDMPLTSPGCRTWIYDPAKKTCRWSRKDAISEAHPDLNVKPSKSTCGWNMDEGR